MPPSAAGCGGRPGSPPSLPAHNLQPAPAASQLPPRGREPTAPGPQCPSSPASQLRGSATPPRGRCRGGSRGAGRKPFGTHRAVSGYRGDRQRQGRAWPRGLASGGVTWARGGGECWVTFGAGTATLSLSLPPRVLRCHHESFTTTSPSPPPQVLNYNLKSFTTTTPSSQLFQHHHKSLITTSPSLPLQLLHHYKSFTTTTSPSPAQVLHYHPLITSPSLPLQLLHHHNSFTTTTSPSPPPQVLHHQNSFTITSTSPSPVPPPQGPV